MRGRRGDAEVASTYRPCELLDSTQWQGAGGKSRKNGRYDADDHGEGMPREIKLMTVLNGAWAASPTSC